MRGGKRRADQKSDPQQKKGLTYKALEGWAEFPKIGLIVNGKKKFYSVGEAVPLWDSGWCRVDDSGELLLADFTIRAMTPEENKAFQCRVDDYSANK